MRSRLTPEQIAVGWSDQILREQVEDVREQKLLVPPIMVASEPDQLSDLPGWPQAKQAGDCLVDMCPVYVDFVQCRPRDHAAPMTRLPRPSVSQYELNGNVNRSSNGL